MNNIITLTVRDGSSIEFFDEVKGSGAMMDVYFSPDKSYVVGFFREKQDANAKARLEDITGKFREKLFNQEGGKYWEDFFCWPTKMVDWNGKTGIVCPTYKAKFFFKGGPFDGKVKEGKWFASAKLWNRFVPADQKGDWLKMVNVCHTLARATEKLHQHGLAMASFSYKEVLIDPLTGSACIIGIPSNLTIPGKYPPDVMGTPDFVAPEVLETKGLPVNDPKKNLPNISTDRHALAVLIYMYLLHRHPLRGGKVWDPDPAKDEELSMSSKALFIEHPTDKTNRPKVDQLAKSELPHGDISKLPYTITGPYLKPLFDKAFIDGLHNPSLRPSANDWEDALVKTTDLMIPCSNPNCQEHWFVFDNTTKPKCPFCGTEYHGYLPVLNFYYSHKAGAFHPENYRLMVYNKQSLYMWHVNRNVIPNEKIEPENRKPVGDFHFLQGRWVLINRKLNNMWDYTDADNKKQIKIGEFVELKEGTKILLDKNVEQGGRLVIVQLVHN